MATKGSHRSAEDADEAADGSVPFSVFFRVFCEREWISKFHAEAAENADEGAEHLVIDVAERFAGIVGIAALVFYGKRL
jgi:hypothetical protein